MTEQQTAKEKRLSIPSANIVFKASSKEGFSRLEKAVMALNNNGFYVDFSTKSGREPILIMELNPLMAAFGVSLYPKNKPLIRVGANHINSGLGYFHFENGKDPTCEFSLRNRYCIIHYTVHYKPK